MKILAIDQSTTCSAWSIFIGNKLEKYGSERCYTPSERKNGLPIDQRIYHMYKYLRNIIISEKPDFIVFEDTFLQKVNSPETFAWLNRLVGCIMCLSIEHDISYKIWQANAWRKLIGMPCGRGVKREQEKEYSVEYANKHYNLELKRKDDDLADALCMGTAYLIMNEKKGEKES